MIIWPSYCTSHLKLNLVLLTSMGSSTDSHVHLKLIMPPGILKAVFDFFKPFSHIFSLFFCFTMPCMGRDCHPHLTDKDNRFRLPEILLSQGHKAQEKSLRLSLLFLTPPCSSFQPHSVWQGAPRDPFVFLCLAWYVDWACHQWWGAHQHAMTVSHA